MTQNADRAAERARAGSSLYGEFLHPQQQDQPDVVGAAPLAAALLNCAHTPDAGVWPLALAVTILWTRFLRHDAADPRWPDRDRVVIGGGDGAALHAALLSLSGDADSEAHLALELIAGSLGLGLGHAVGLALAERLLTGRFGRSLVDHRTWAVATSRDLASGLGHEVSSLAGQLRLGRLTVLWRDPADGESSGRGGDEIARRFAAYGWMVKRVNASSEADVVSALSAAVRSPKPTLLACGVRHAVSFTGNEDISGTVRAAWADAGARGAPARRAWLRRLAQHALRGEFERVMAARLPPGLTEALDALRASFAASRPAMATRAASQNVLEAVVPRMPELIGGVGDLGSTATASSVSPHGQARRPPQHWAIGDHGTATALNGLALHGGLVPYGGTFVVFTDHMRPALRMAGLLGQRVIHVLTRDGGDRAEEGAEDGPAHQAIEQLASLRAMPNLYVFRPADAIETAECWALALRRDDGPSLLALSRQPVPSLRPPGQAGDNRAARGGYVLADADGGRQATIVASGPEVAAAMAARQELRREGVRVAVVSLPCWELFEQLDRAEQDAVLGAAPRVGVEAGGSFGWARWLGSDGRFVGFTAPTAEGHASPATAQARPSASDIVAAIRHCLRLA